ncbi:MAG: hypothetical protein ACI9VR_004298, partial [Cognaticolwellia sp.]
SLGYRGVVALGSEDGLRRWAQKMGSDTGYRDESQIVRGQTVEPSHGNYSAKFSLLDLRFSSTEFRTPHSER